MARSAYSGNFRGCLSWSKFEKLPGVGNRGIMEKKSTSVLLLAKARKKLVRAKNENIWLLWLYTEFLLIKGNRALRKYSDLEGVNRLYYASAGRYPNLKSPTLFSEKLQWIKLNYQDPLMARCVDKFEVRAYIKERGYGDLLNDLIAVYETADEIDIDKLPSRFVLKGTHGSGWNLICRDRNEVSWRPWRKVMKCWFKYDFFVNGREFVYRGIKPRIVCERYLEDASGGLVDYKFFCFNGDPCFVQANLGRRTRQHVQNFYDMQWKLKPFGKGLEPNPDENIDKPSHFERMIEIARDLSTPFPFVRVDFYNVDGKIYFGELTFFPNAGKPNFTPAKYDLVVGDMLELPPALNS